MTRNAAYTARSPSPRRGLASLVRVVSLWIALALLSRGPAAAEPTCIPEARAILDRASADLDIGLRARALQLRIRQELSRPGGGQGEQRGTALRALYDPAPWVQHLAVRELLHHLSDPEARELLVAYVARQQAAPYVRGHAALALSLRGVRDHAETVEQTWRQAGPPWRSAPLLLAAAHLGDAQALEVLQGALAEGRFPLETTFFVDIGRSGLVELVPSLKRAADRVEEELVPPVAVALLLLGSPRGEWLLWQNARQGGQEGALEALEYLRDVEDRRARRFLRRTSLRRGGPVGELALLLRVGMGGRRPAVAFRRYKEGDRETRTWILAALERRALHHGLGNREAARARSLVLDAVEDPELTVQIQALRALAVLGEPKDTADLVAFLDFTHPFRAVEAAGACLALTGVKGEP